jgi:hypothetical protein
MKTRLLTLLFVCFFTVANTFAIDRYWVGGAASTWDATTSWSETSGGASGASIPDSTMNVIFDNSQGNANPTVTLTKVSKADSLVFTVSNVTFAGALAMTVNKMTVDSSQVKFVDHVTVISALTFLRKDARITQQSASSGRAFRMGNGGGPFKLTGNSATNYITGNSNAYYTFDTSTPLTVYFNPTATTAGAIVVIRGLITLGNNIKSNRITLNATNNQELIVGSGATLELVGAGSSNYTGLPNGGVINASALGSKVLIKSTAVTVLGAQPDGPSIAGKIFKENATINHLEFNSTLTFFLPQSITVRSLTLTAGVINNSTNGITVEAGGGVFTVAGSTTVPVATGAALTRYWVGGYAGNWSNPASWGTASGSTTTPGIPGFGDVVIFDASAGNESPTVTLTESIAADSLVFTNSNVIFDGIFAISANKMTINGCQPNFVCTLTINNALTFNDALARLSHLPSGTSIYRVTFGNGNAFTLTGNSVDNYLEGNALTNFTFNTTSALTAYFKDNVYVGVINVEKGLITLGSSISSVRINFWDNRLNGQELILGENVTFTIAPGGSSNLTNKANGGVLDASAKGSKVVLNTIAPSLLKSGDKRLFKADKTIYALEMNSIDSTYVLGYPITVKNLYLSAGKIDNATNNITIATAGKITTTNGATTAAVIPGLPGEPTNVAATAGKAKASVSFAAPDGDGGTAILDYTVISSPGGVTAIGSDSPIDVTGLTNGVAYTFTVKVSNNIGESMLSLPSNAVTPALNAAIQSVTDNNIAVFKFRNETVTITYNSDSSNKAIFKLLSLNGQVLKAHSLTTQSGNNTNSIAVGNLPKGMYIVSLCDGTNTLTDKIIKQ